MAESSYGQSGSWSEVERSFCWWSAILSLVSTITNIFIVVKVVFLLRMMNASSAPAIDRDHGEAVIQSNEPKGWQIFWTQFSAR